MKNNESEIVLLASSFAMQLTKGLSLEELEDLKIFLNQVCCSVNSLISIKLCNLKKNKNQH
ncbi:MAG: hypothetical protein E7375_00635 [Clostridiales bacterium]|nr:hypothetical protein [Clostridiales bacterium]